MENAIVLRNVSKTFAGGVRALDDVSLEVREGEWLSLTGPSGSGKTTLLNLVAGLERPTSGEVCVAGNPLSALSPREQAALRRDAIGLVFQSFYLIPHLTALENVMLAQYLHSMADEAEAAEVLEWVGLGDRLHHLPSQLSGGEKQRVCIARAVANRPWILLADEPTGNLDEANEDRVMDLFAELHREGRTIVIASHDPKIVRMGSRLTRLHHGRLLGTPGSGASRADEEAHGVRPRQAES